MRLKDSESPTPQTLGDYEIAINELLGDYDDDIKKICDFKYTSDSSNTKPFNFYAKFLVNKKLLMILAPKMIVSLKSQPLKVTLSLLL